MYRKNRSRFENDTLRQTVSACSAKVSLLGSDSDRMSGKHLTEDAIAKFKEAFMLFEKDAKQPGHMKVFNLFLASMLS